MTDSPEPKDKRIPVMMAGSEVETIDEWRFQNRIPTRSEAIRQLCKAGLIAHANIAPMAGALASAIRAMQEASRIASGIHESGRAPTDQETMLLITLDQASKSLAGAGTLIADMTHRISGEMVKAESEIAELEQAAKGLSGTPKD